MAPKARKRYGPFTVVGWSAIAGGGIVVYVIYRRFRAGQAASSSTALTGGTTIPTGQTTTTSTPSLSSWAAWEEAALAEMIGPKYTATQALNDLQAWIQGGCVSQTGYTAIGAAIASLGVPPGLGTSLPTLVVCPTKNQQPGPTPAPTPAPGPTPQGNPPGNPPALPAALAQAMKGNGESIVGTAWDAANHTWLYLTNKGGVYDLTQTGAPGAGYEGSYLSLPSSATQVPQGQPQRTFSQILVDAAGGYTLVATDGATYHFGP